MSTVWQKRKALSDACKVLYPELDLNKLREYGISYLKEIIRCGNKCHPYGWALDTRKGVK